ncbi:MAG TPA: hypothetical protein VHO69_18320 [Phototrophicaceae bacterium]|nr:hypothetical protein [Phototrophicaceae bacterium]
MNYCTPYPIAKSVWDYLDGTLNILHFPRFWEATSYIPLLRSLPVRCRWSFDLKLQRRDRGEFTLNGHQWQEIQ